MRYIITNRSNGHRYEFGDTDLANETLEQRLLRKSVVYGTNPIVDVVDTTADAEAAIARQVIGMVQARLDDLARSWGYDHILSLESYATSSVPRFAAEGQAGAAWRDATWAYVDQAQHTAPSLESLLAGLPPIPERPITDSSS